VPGLGAVENKINSFASAEYRTQLFHRKAHSLAHALAELPGTMETAVDNISPSGLFILLFCCFYRDFFIIFLR
jgi:hypothetical protein